MKFILKILFKWFEDIQQIEDVRRHTFAMINAVLIVAFVLLSVKFGIGLSEYKNRISYLEDKQEILTAQVNYSKEKISELKIKEKIFDDLLLTYESDWAQQQEWNEQRSYLSNENFHLFVEEVVKKYEESEGN